MAFKPRIKFKLRGVNQARLIDKLTKKNVVCYEIRKENYNELAFKIDIERYEIAKKIILTEDYQIIREESCGYVAWGKRALLRVGIFVGLIFCAIAAAVLNNFLLKIEITGAETIKNAEIIEYLSANNITEFSPKQAVNADELEFNLMEEFKQISLVTVMQKGSTLIISIKEKSQLEEDLNAPHTDLTSAYNGRITKFTLLSGTANIEVGDLVKKGEVLVYSYFKNSSGEVVPIEAKAEITMEVWLESSVVYNPTQIAKLETGTEIMYYEVSIFNLLLYSNKPDKIPLNYEIYQSESKIQNVILPIKITKFHLKEVELQEIFVPFEEKKEEIIKKCKENTLQMVQINDIIKTENCSIEQCGDNLVVTYLITVEKTIS